MRPQLHRLEGLQITPGGSETVIAFTVTVTNIVGEVYPTLAVGALQQVRVHHDCWLWQAIQESGIVGRSLKETSW